VTSGLFVLSLILKATATLAATLSLLKLCHRTPASMRHLIVVAGFAILAILPIATIAMPPVVVEVLAAPSFVNRSDPSSVDNAFEAEIVTSGTSSSEKQSFPFSISAVLITAWIVGTALFLAPVAWGLWQVRQLRRCGWPWLEGQALAVRIAVDSGVRRHVLVLRHEHVTGPMTCGLFRTTILLPTDARTWNTDALRRALVHEVEHARRYDWIVHCLTRIVCAVYWFHPFVWVAWRQLRLEAERACDDAVVRRDDAGEYASLLIQVAQTQLRGAREPMLAMANRGDLAVRVAAVLNPDQARGRVSIPTVVVASIGVTVVSAAVGAVTFAQSQRNPQPLPPVLSVVKRNVSGDVQSRLGVPHRNRFVATNVTIAEVIAAAYGNLLPLRADQVVGGPGWMRSERYDVEAKLDTSVGDDEPFAGVEPIDDRGVVDQFAMVRAVLAERFKLGTRETTKNGPVYILMRTGSADDVGAQIKVSKTDCEAISAAGPYTVLVGPDGQPMRPCGVRRRPGQIVGTGATTQQLAQQLTRVATVEREVLNRTGLTGRFDFTLTWTPPPTPGSREAAAVIDGGPSIFAAVQEQLGLKLQAQRGPVRVLVVDRLERPTPN